MAEPACHYCDRPAEAQCPTCGRLYCPEHGDDVCLRCLSPESATPSVIAYRGSIVALVLATIVVIFLVVRPPESKSAADSVRSIGTSTPAVGATATPTRPGGPTRTATVEATASAQPSGTPTVAGSPTAPGERTYTVKTGDTLSGIAAQFNITVAALRSANPGTTDTIQPGDVLKIPPQ
jgi:LysM repeat protein